jgi:hypothetical protein
MKIEQHCMQLELNLNSNSIVDKWDANWWKKYCKFAHAYDVGKIIFKKKHIYEKTPFSSLWEWVKQISI